MTGDKSNFDRMPLLKSAGLEDNAMSTAQEGVVLPLVCGSAACPAKWISPIYSQFATVAPQERPAKK
jgi:hypothetical protein